MIPNITLIRGNVAAQATRSFNVFKANKVSWKNFRFINVLSDVRLTDIV